MERPSLLHVLQHGADDKVERARGEATLATIRLIAEPPIRLGPLVIDPPRRRLVHDDGREDILEPRVMQVLIALARIPGAILSRDDLMVCCWEGRIVGDDALNRVMSRLRRVSHEIGAGVLRLETITKVGVRLILTDALDRTDPLPAPSIQVVDGTAPTPRRTETVSDRPAFPVGPTALVGAVVSLGLVALLGGVVAWRWAGTGRSIPELRLATFENLTPTLAPGAEQTLRQDIMAALGRSSKLQLFSEGGKDVAGPSTFGLGGSVQQVGTGLRFAFTLDRGRPSEIVWSSVIVRPWADAAAPQQVAAQVSFTVRCVLAGATSYRGTLPHAALSNFANFCAEVGASESGEAVSRMTEDLRQAVAAAPDFAAGWAALGDVIADKFAYPTSLWDAGGRTEAVQAVEHALRLDPQNSVGHLAKGLLVPWPNYAGREEELRLAVKGLDTFGDAHAAYARFLISVGRVKEAAFVAEHAYDLDQDDREAISRLVEAFYMLDRVPEADALWAKADGLWGSSPKLTIYKLWGALWDGHHAEAINTLQTGRYDEAIRNVGPDAGAPSPIADAGVAVFKALDAGDAAERAAAANTLARRAADPRTIDPFDPVALAALGRDQDALSAEARVVKEWSTSLTVLLFTPPFANARRTPQFANLVDRLGLLSYWRLPGRAPDFCGDRDPPPVCRQLH
jgi:DNA-binding winged helix-turn-helix (wHTH) protein/tetratricopeptide (TPR) repeat protein